MRSGIHALYQGREFKAVKDFANNQVLLLSEEAAERSNGFMQNRTGIYVKSVQMNELETAYEIKTRVVYGGRVFHGNETGSGQILIFHLGDEGLQEAKDLGLKMVEPGVCEMIIEKHEVEEYVEEKKPIWGFPMPPGHQGE